MYDLNEAAPLQCGFEESPTPVYTCPCSSPQCPGSSVNELCVQWPARLPAHMTHPALYTIVAFTK